jgi:hypothetical protein
MNAFEAGGGEAWSILAAWIAPLETQNFAIL